MAWKAEGRQDWQAPKRPGTCCPAPAAMASTAQLRHTPRVLRRRAARPGAAGAWPRQLCEGPAGRG
jgi:hypothetical protein